MLNSLLLLLVCLVAQVDGQPRKTHDFWKLESERAGAVTVVTFAAQKAPNKGQGILMCAHWPRQEGEDELRPTEVVSSMYSELKEFQLLGSKDADWSGQPARLLAFKAKVGQKPVVGRALMAQTPERTETLLLITNHDPPKEFAREFERLQGHWDFGRPAASNVLYSD
jgi:hypothetical protein